MWFWWPLFSLYSLHLSNSPQPTSMSSILKQPAESSECWPFAHGSICFLWSMDKLLAATFRNKNDNPFPNCYQLAIAPQLGEVLEGTLELGLTWSSTRLVQATIATACSCVQWPCHIWTIAFQSCVPYPQRLHSSYSFPHDAPLGGRSLLYTVQLWLSTHSHLRPAFWAVMCSFIHHYPPLFVILIVNSEGYLEHIGHHHFAYISVLRHTFKICRQ